MKCSWTIDRENAGAEVTPYFSSLDEVMSLRGEPVTKSPISDLILLDIAGARYYVKRYYRSGKMLRRFVGRSRVRAEWENLQFFQCLGLKTPPLVAWGERGGRGALITREIPGAMDLQAVQRLRPDLLGDSVWLGLVLEQVSEAARRLHAQGFAHNDFKWRNILVTGEASPTVYLIDCPTGERWRGPLLEYRKIKDLACLDKVAKYHLSRTQRLRFYLRYANRDRLSRSDKKVIQRTLKFFQGRE